MTHAGMLAWAAALGGAAVVLGAFAAHGLKSGLAGPLDAEALAAFETGVRYQMYHALALGLCALLARSGAPPRWAARLFVGGVLLFSGSLYLLALTGHKMLGAVT